MRKKIVLAEKAGQITAADLERHYKFHSKDKTRIEAIKPFTILSSPLRPAEVK